jgi:probable rRNA maturation factor
MKTTHSGWRPSCDPRSGRDHVMTASGLDIEVLGIDLLVPDAPTALEVRELCVLALASAGIEEGHLAVEFVDEDRIRELNREYRDKDTPTDVLSFGVDEDGDPAGPRELGDIVICPEHTTDLREAVVHGTLHLTGMDHEVDDGEMLALQAELMRWVR